MGTKAPTPHNIDWQTPAYLEGVPDGLYPVLCSLEMEPPIQDPIYVNPNVRIGVKNGWINLTDAAATVTEAVREVGGSYNAIVGVALVRSKAQFIVLWEHNSPSSLQVGTVN